MATTTNLKEGDVLRVPISLIEPNPHNPRVIFNQEKMDDLIISIKERGVLVPLSVYIDKKTKKFIIIDGERRYRASRLVGLDTLPIIVSHKDQEGDYAINMFHIHTMRENWELIPTAVELDRISKIIEAEKKRKPTITELKNVTGLPLSQIKRCKMALSFPPEVRSLLLQEEAKTKKEKSEMGKEKILTEDFFIEITKNLIEPLEDYNQKTFRELGGKNKIYSDLIAKRRGGKIRNIVTLRPLSKRIRDNPIKAAIAIKSFFNNPEQTSDDLLDKVNLTFDPYTFQRNVNVYFGALDSIPKLKDELKLNVIKILNSVIKKTKEKIKEID